MKDIVLIAQADCTHLRELIGLKAPPLKLIMPQLHLCARMVSPSVSVDDNVEGIGPRRIARSLEQIVFMRFGVTAATYTLSSPQIMPTL